MSKVKTAATNIIQEAKPVIIVVGGGVAIYLMWNIYKGIKWTLEKGGDIVDGVANGLGVGPEADKTREMIKQVIANPIDNPFDPKFLSTLANKNKSVKYKILTKADVDRFKKIMKDNQGFIASQYGATAVFDAFMKFFQNKTQISYFANEWKRYTGNDFLHDLREIIAGNKLSPVYEDMMQKIISRAKSLPL